LFWYFGRHSSLLVDQLFISNAREYDEFPQLEFHSISYCRIFMLKKVEIKNYLQGGQIPQNARRFTMEHGST